MGNQRPHEIGERLGMGAGAGMGVVWDGAIKGGRGTPARPAGHYERQIGQEAKGEGDGGCEGPLKARSRRWAGLDGHEG